MQRFELVRWCYGLIRTLSECLMLTCRLPGLFENLIRPPSSGPGLQAYISLYNSIWLFVFVCVAYGVVRVTLILIVALQFKQISHSCNVMLLCWVWCINV